MSFKGPSFAAIRDKRARFGARATARLALHRLLNSVMRLERLNIIILDRDHMRPLDPALTERLSSRLATLADLKAMQGDPRLDIHQERLTSFRAGDSCLLSYVDGELAGYTWVHTLGRPELMPGLVISVPTQFLYNYAALTLPEFRGLGLQAYRHHQLLDSGLWDDKVGLLGFVMQTNFASRHGQAKSGYRTIGSIRLVGGHRHFTALFSRSLRRLGIGRL